MSKTSEERADEIATWIPQHAMRVEGGATLVFDHDAIKRQIAMHISVAEHYARLDQSDLVRWLREHSAHGEAEIKTIGLSWFDPRLHCSVCRRRCEASS